MTTGGPFKTVAVAALVALVWTAGEAGAAQCGNTSAGFEAWKSQFANEARGKVSPSAIAALMATTYSTATISADRGQRSFKLSLDQFLAKRGGPAIVARGRTLKQTHAAMFASIEQRYGVPPGPLLAIWGMETGFGADRGKHNVLSATATLAYDCRRSAFFTEHLYAALTLIDRKIITADARGAAHGTSSRAMAGARARDINKASPISRRSRDGTLPPSTSRRSRLWANRSTREAARLRSAEAVDRSPQQVARLERSESRDGCPHRHHPGFRYAQSGLRAIEAPR
jgi:hypothetical protein